MNLKIQIPSRSSRIDGRKIPSPCHRIVREIPFLGVWMSTMPCNVYMKEIELTHVFGCLSCLGYVPSDMLEKPNGSRWRCIFCPLWNTAGFRKEILRRFNGTIQAAKQAARFEMLLWGGVLDVLVTSSKLLSSVRILWWIALQTKQNIHHLPTMSSENSSFVNLSSACVSRRAI